MDKINGEYKFFIEVAGDGFIHSITAWGATQNDAIEKSKEMIPGCTEIRSIEITEVTAQDVKKSIHEKACELELLCHVQEMKKEDAFDELAKYIKTLGNI